MHIRKILIAAAAAALASASGVASAHPHVENGPVCTAATPLRGLDEVEQVLFGKIAPTLGDRLLKGAAAHARVRPPTMGKEGIFPFPPFMGATLYVETAPVAWAQRIGFPPLATLNPVRCSTVLLVATY